MKNLKLYIAPCGLYCGNCADMLSHECHGCNCFCGDCAAAGHHHICEIYQCAKEKELTTCADCDDFPCTTLIQFAYDPIWQTHRVVLENLRRIRKIGLDAWLEEQNEYWSDKETLKKWVCFHDKCGEEWQAQRKK